MLTALVLAISLPACGPRAAAPPGPASFPPRTEGTPEALASHLDGLEYRFENTPVADPQVARTNLDAYTQAVLATAEPLWADSDAPLGLRIKAGEMILQAALDRVEFEDEALDRLLSWADRIEREAPADSTLAPTAAYFRYLGVKDAPAAQLPDPAKKTELLADAVLKLGRARPIRPETAEILGQTADLARAQGLEERAAELYAVLAEAFPEAPLGKRAAGLARRLRADGQVIDDIEGNTLSGERVDVEDARGKVVLVMFYGTYWQPVELLELAELKALRQQYGPDRLAILGVLFDDSPLRARQFLDQNELDWPHIFGPSEGPTPMPAPAALRLGVEASPHYMVLDREGRLLTSAGTLAEVEPALKAQLDSPAEATPAPAPETAPTAPDATPDPDAETPVESGDPETPPADLD